MSCSICLLPFVPGPLSVAPRPPPAGILSPQQDAYLQVAYGLGTRIMGTLAKYDYLDNNVFGSFTGMFVKWEGETGTFFMMHVTCANILRSVFDAESMKNEDLIRLLEIEEVLGRPMAGRNASRLPFVPYEDVGSPVDKVDIRPFWKKGHDLGLNVFLWKKFSQSDANWALAKPDIFPRFYPQVKRTAGLDASAPQPGILMRQPIDVLLLILPYLTLPAYLALCSTCRLIRNHALTTFQPHARARVLELGWAVPLIAVGEYDAVLKRNASAAQALAHPELSPASGDWLLYLSHVHRTSSMRARRRIWNMCLAIQHTVQQRLSSSHYGKNIEVERAKLEKNVVSLPKAIGKFLNLDQATLGKMAEMMPKSQWRMDDLMNFGI